MIISIDHGNRNVKTGHGLCFNSGFTKSATVPPMSKDVVFYDKETLDICRVRPGFTGPTQVCDRNSELSWESVFEKDMQYASKVTFWGDVKLFFGTFIAIFKGGCSSGANDGETKDRREYYYPDYLLKSGKITEQQYNLGLMKANNMKSGETVGYMDELHNLKN